MEESCHSEENTEQYTAFDPESELSKLTENQRALPNEQRLSARKTEFAEYKDDLLGQREEIADISLIIEKMVEINPSVSFDDLHQVVIDKSKQARLTSEQIATFDQRIRNYIEANSSINLVIDQYKEDYGDNWENELFKRMFGQYPSGKVTLIIKPAFMFWELENNEDYKATRERLNDQLMSRGLNEKEGLKIDHTLRVPSFVFTDELMPDLKATVGVRRSYTQIGPVKLDAGHRVKTQEVIHEGVHARDFVIEPLDSMDEVLGDLEGLISESSESDVENFVINLFGKIEPLLLRIGRSEFLAYLEHSRLYFGDWNRGFIASMVSTVLSRAAKRVFPFQNLRSYNYNEIIYEGLANRIQKRTGKDFSSTVGKVMDQLLPSITDKITRFFDAASVIGKNAKLQPDQLDWLLQNEPIENWPMLARIYSEGR